MNTKRLVELDALRGIAAICVVLFHYSTRYDEIFGHEKSNYITTFSFGHFGVQLFFIISGFVIYMSILKAKSARDFLIKRSFRLYPAYVFAVVLTFSIVTFSNLDRLKVSIIDAMINLTMMQGFVPGVDAVDGAYWSLRVEITFYFIMAFLLFLNVEKKVMWIASIWLIGSAVIQLIHTFRDSYFTLLLESFTISEFSQLFIIGMMFYEIWMKNDRIKYYFMIALCVLYDLIFVGIESAIFTMFFVIVFYLVVKGKLKVLNSKILIFLGVISYPFYLLHQFIGYVIIDLLESYGFTSELFVIVPLVVSMAIAYFVYRYIEQPMQNKLHMKYKKYKLTKQQKVNNNVIRS